MNVLVYLDNCAIQRPFDDAGQPRIALERECILQILKKVESTELELVSSDALRYETRNNPNAMRREFAHAVLSLCKSHISVNERIRHRASALIESGLMPLDALHLACADEAGADYFCTCDDGIIRKADNLKGLKVRIVLPLQLIEVL